MTQETLEKIRRGVKVDTSLHELYWETRREREAMGLPPPENDISNPEKVFAEWRSEHAAAKATAQQKASPKQSKRLLRQFTIFIEQASAHGHLAYCPAVNGKRLRGETVVETRKKMTHYLVSHFQKQAAQSKSLPKTNGRIEKVQIAIPQP